MPVPSLGIETVPKICFRLSRASAVKTNPVQATRKPAFLAFLHHAQSLCELPAIGGRSRGANTSRTSRRDSESDSHPRSEGDAASVQPLACSSAAGTPAGGGRRPDLLRSRRGSGRSGGNCLVPRISSATELACRRVSDRSDRSSAVDEAAGANVVYRTSNSVATPSLTRSRLSFSYEQRS